MNANTNKVNCIKTGLMIFVIFCTAALRPGLYGAGFTISGKVKDSESKKSLPGATVAVIELKKKVKTGADGVYSVGVPGKGTYTIAAIAAGYRVYRTTVNANNDINNDIHLVPESGTMTGLTVKGKREAQELSHHVMTSENIKEAPATFGDSFNAITALPGITRTDGFFGPLVIRGAPESSNYYSIDDIPIYSPYHLGGLHSIINNNIIQEIELFSSSFPAEYGSSTAAVINIKTADEVRKMNVYTDISLLSANFLFQTPLSFGNGETENTNSNYFIASGRYGYLGLTAPLWTDKNELEVVPEYWDYQSKFKYYINKSNSLTLFFLGSRDYFRILKKKQIDKSEDPLLAEYDMKMDQSYHSQAISLTSKPSEKFENKVLLFSVLNDSYMYYNFPESTQEWAKDVHVNSRPYIYGLRNKTKVEWWEKHAEVRTGIEYTMYDFKAHGKSFIPRAVIDEFDVSDPNVALAYRIDAKIRNHVIGEYIENKFTFNGLTFMPGIRSDYLTRSKQATFDPRAMISYEFPSATAISAAGGKYSYFIQTNPQLFYLWPDVAGIGNKLKPETAIHRTAGIEQKIELFTVKIEGFYNTFRNLAQGYAHTESDGSYLAGLSSGKQITRGFEIMLRKDRLENRGGFFGWISYTYTRSKFKSGLPTMPGYAGVPGNIAGDRYGDTWINFWMEQRHSLKFTSGYTLGNHTLSGKFQYYSSFPYTPIKGARLDTEYFAKTGKYRYVPIYGKRNSKHFEPSHRLDLRYSYKKNYSWGYVNMYVEVLNVYNYKPKNVLRWDYRYDYGDDNPEITADKENIFAGVMPNFGVEIKF